MGPPLGHVRDPEKQSRFVEAELSALLQEAGGTLPVIKKNEKGVYVIVEAEGAVHGHAAPAAAAKSAPARPAAPAATTPPAVAAKPTAPTAQATTVAEKAMTPPAAPKAAAEPNRSLNKRSTYAGVVDTGPFPGETKEQKIERLQKVVAGAKQRAEEGGGEHASVTVIDSSPSADAHRPAAEAQAETGAASAAPLSAPAATASPVAGAETPAELAPDSVAPTTT